MSSATELQNEIVSNYVNTSANALLLYDIIVTFCDEVNVIWRRKWTAITWIYALTRYSTAVLSILTFPTTSTIKSCEALLYLMNGLLLIQFLCSALFSTLRVYALSKGRFGYITAGLVLMLNLVPFAGNMFDSIVTKVIFDSEACVEVFLGSADLSLFLSLFTRLSVIIADALVLLVTWIKTAKLYREARQHNIKAPLAAMLIRDGTFYFLYALSVYSSVIRTIINITLVSIILLVANVLQVLGHNVPVLVTLNVVSPFFRILPSLIICRFILSLRQVKPAGNSWGSVNQSFSLRFVGNIGQPLQFGGHDEEIDELEGDEHIIELDGLPELATETSNSSGAGEGATGWRQ